VFLSALGLQAGRTDRLTDGHG